MLAEASITQAVAELDFLSDGIAQPRCDLAADHETIEPLLPGLRHQPTSFEIHSSHCLATSAQLNNWGMYT